MVQLGEGRGGAGRLGGHRLTPSPVPVPDEMVRGACEAAVATARGLERSAVPGPMRPYLKMQWLPGAALAPIRRVLDADDAFRASVAGVATEEMVGRASFLFLTRPDGWAEELGALAVATSDVEAVSAEERAERSAARRVAGLEARVADLTAHLDAAIASLAAAESRAAAEAERRAAADASASALSAQVDALRHERDDARARVARAEARVAEAEAALAEVVSSPPPSQPASPVVDTAALSSAIDAAAAALARAASLLADAAVAEGDPPVSPARSSSPSAAERSRRRVPVALPMGVFDDSAEAAEHLVRVPGAVLVVDGYNCTLRDEVLAGLPIPEQRRRLVDALGELAARTGVEVEVVFDGGDVGESPVASGGGRRGVRVRFSAPGEEADDDVIARVVSLPPERPVVVASSDRRVRAGAAPGGANVISAEQLIGLVRARR